MKVALLGPTGELGSRLTGKLLSKGYQVTGVARNLRESKHRKGVTLFQVDVENEALLTGVLWGHDAVIHNLPFINTDPTKIITAVEKAGVPRLLVVADVRAFEIGSGLVCFDVPHLPVESRREVVAAIVFLNALQNQKNLSWTFLTPSRILAPREPCGAERLDKDPSSIPAAQQPKVCVEDFATGVVNELMHPKYICKCLRPALL